MRFLEEYVGGLIILCIIPIHFIKTLFSPPPSSSSKAPENILILKFFGIGSIINAVPLVREINKTYPEAKIHFLTFSSNKNLLEIINIADTVKTVNPATLFSFVTDNMRTLYWLFCQKIDVCLDLEFFSRYSMIISYFSGAPKRVGFCSLRNIRDTLLTHEIPFNHYKHISRVFMATAEAIGIEYDQSLPLDCRFSPLEPQHVDALKALINTKHLNQVITINTNASDLCKLRKWPEKKFVALINILLKKFPQYHYALIGSKTEYNDVQAIFDACNPANGNLINIAGKTNLQELMTLLAHNKLIISNDSGPVHIAAGYQTNTVVLFGPETPVLYHPLNVNARVLYKGLYCSPCINVLDNKKFKHCKNRRCMHEISVADVLHELQTHFIDSCT